MTNNSSIILYRTPDGTTEIRLRAEDGSVWLSQAEIADLFQTTKQNVSLHIKNIFQQSELQEDSVVKETLTTAADNKAYATKFYRLEAILAVGYRVSSPRGVQFRQWATTILREYLIKGFALNDDRLKNPDSDEGGYFHELLERIREIRASEKRFYQKVRDIYATSVDYDPASEAAQMFFATVQNKMLFAVTGRTAAELLSDRADTAKPNMGLTSWKGSRVRKTDVITAKNYLVLGEITELNRIVTMFLDYAEDQAQRQQTTTMLEWSEKLDRFLAFNERALLKNAGTLSAEDAKKIVFEKYDSFDAIRHSHETDEAEREHFDELKQIEATIDHSKGKKPKK